MRDTGRVKVGVIGAGRIGQLHAEHLQFQIRNAEVVGVADVAKSAADSTARHCSIALSTADYRHLLDHNSIQAILICSPTNTHADLIQESATAGKHIFCEKPIALELPAIDAALRAVRQAGVKLQIGFNRRFDSNFRSIKESILAGRIGTPQVLRITSRDPEPPPLEYLRVSGGIFLDMAIHDFDMARYLMGSEITEVFAAGNVLVDQRFEQADDVDTAVITLKFESGAIGTIDNSRQAVYGYDQRVEVFGSKGVVTASNNFPDNHTVVDAQGVHSSKPLYFFIERYKASFLKELQAFIDAVQNDTEPLVSGLDGLMPAKIGLAARMSLYKNRPVKIDEIG